VHQKAHLKESADKKIKSSMKKIIAVIFFAIIFIGCKSNDKIEQPNKVFSSFAEALSKKDLTKARELCTNESKTVLDFLEKKSSNMKISSMDKFDTSKVTFGEVIIDGDDAKIPIKDKESGVTVYFPLKKEDGVWKIAFDMKSLFDMSMETLKDPKLNIPADKLDSLMKKFKSVNLDSLEKEMGIKDDTVHIKR
jgi:hypothetical protein